MKNRLIALVIILAAALVGYFVYSSEEANNRFAFKLGLDLNGGSHLVYKADISKVAPSDVNSSMSALRDVIEKRVNLFGVSEPLVQVESGGVGSTISQKLIVELPGVTDIEKAISLIGKTPLLEFRLAKEQPPVQGATTTQVVFEDTGITGSLVQRAQVEFDPTTGSPYVLLTFNSEGKDLFAKVTKAHIGEVLGIFLDGEAISLPVIREQIADGRAQISGTFTPQEAKTLVRDLNYGALPVPIELVSTQKVGASLGEGALTGGLRAGVGSFIVIALFLILWYRLPGVLAVVALGVYTAIMLALFKLIPVTLTAAGIAGFILSIGMAVDANILIFERMKEEFRKKGSVDGVIREGFSRAWLSIRDSNLSSIITAAILFWFSNTSIIKGFALIFVIGVLVSMFTAITVTRSFLLALSHKRHEGVMKFLFGSGITSS
ncbi:MAG: protein-export membrane protein SecD [Candidatus Taylorbacteria bacterium RIFCSPHIGHO2_01_FULL_46_22b]|uniref:Protein translocase subunit SecD n=1 Tax=Candidatus Taylorbacteria bacterium RIFCSPHIGHO2_01_FULL_46_22b TaxID=1802301 RepID=A0A1G2M488_9BACT|nr:MAG: protein-export membrane protein SecD [Candidatus Taylorbacteria bacterium RIFCSPHIGHO2_01_FULL_46_22b]